MELLATLYANHTATMLTLQAMIFLLQAGPHAISADVHLCVTFATSTVGTDTTSALGHLDKVVIFELSVCTFDGTVFAIVHVFAHLFLFAAGYADEVVEGFAGGVELVADVGRLVVAVEV